MVAIGQFALLYHVSLCPAEFFSADLYINSAVFAVRTENTCLRVTKPKKKY
jgi:hypothetical protein